jgi:hypothetical protein
MGLNGLDIRSLPLSKQAKTWKDCQRYCDLSQTGKSKKGAEPLHRSGNRTSGRTEIVTCCSMLDLFSSGLRTSA